MLLVRARSIRKGRVWNIAGAYSRHNYGFRLVSQAKSICSIAGNHSVLRRYRIHLIEVSCSSRP